MNKENLERYTDYLICTNSYTTATGLSAMLEGDKVMTRSRFLSAREYGAKELWDAVKATVRHIERDDGCLIFDNTLQEKAWTDENEIVCDTMTTAKGVRSKASTC